MTIVAQVLKEIESLSERIKEYEARMEKIAKESYPQVARLKQVRGVGTQIGLTYILTLDDPHRFPKSREVGCFLGLRPGRRDSGQSQPQMHITKEVTAICERCWYRGALHSGTLWRRQ
jgi:transposase